jgi:hypothetical protein
LASGQAVLRGACMATAAEIGLYWVFGRHAVTVSMPSGYDIASAILLVRGFEVCLDGWCHGQLAQGRCALRILQLLRAPTIAEPDCSMMNAVVHLLFGALWLAAARWLASNMIGIVGFLLSSCSVGFLLSTCLNLLRVAG